VLLALGAIVSGCTAGGGNTPVLQSPMAPAPVVTAPARPAGPTIALLAPLNAGNTGLGDAMVKAANIALDIPNAPKFAAYDTAGTPEGAANAARTAIAAGARLITGPLTAPETAAVAPIARSAGVPVLAFTSDPAQAQPGVWTLGLTPAQQVRRLVAAAAAQSRTRIAALLPRNPFGDAMAQALTAAASSLSLPPPKIVRYDGGFTAMTAAVKEISDYASRRAPVDAKVKAARQEATPEGRKTAADLAKQDIPPPDFDALLLAESGDRLRQILALLPYYDVSAPQVRILGPALWASDAARAPDLAGAWYAAPDSDARTTFADRYQAKYGSVPPPLADLAYDSVAIGRVLATEGDFSIGALVRPDGFAGVDGVLGLLPDGHVRRGLALFEVQRGGADKIEPAPSTLSSPGV